jgi:hypothetical protein
VGYSTTGRSSSGPVSRTRLRAEAHLKLPTHSSLRARKLTHSYGAGLIAFFVRNTGRTDDAVVIMVIMMQQHTNIYKLHLAARLAAGSSSQFRRCFWSEV